MPASAVRQESGGPYVLALEEQNTLLGLQNVLVSLPVTVLESGDNHRCGDRPAGPHDAGRVGSNKAVAAGDRVRVNDAV